MVAPPLVHEQAGGHVVIAEFQQPVVPPLREPRPLPTRPDHDEAQVEDAGARRRQVVVEDGGAIVIGVDQMGREQDVVLGQQVHQG